MAIQIPELKRMNVPEDASVGRITPHAPDLVSPMETQSNALNNLGKTIEDQYSKYEDAASNTEGMKAANAYDNWYRKQLEGDSENNIPGLRHLQGDATKAYNDFDKEAQQKYDELANNPDLSPKAQMIVNKMLANKHNSLYDTRLLYYGQQNAKYTENLTDSLVGQAKQTAASGLMFFDPKDPKSTAMFDQSKSEMEHLRVSNALKMGAAVEDPNGTYLYVDDFGNTKRLNVNPIVKQEIVKERSKLVFESIDSLIESKSLDKARLAMDKYGGELDVVAKGKIDEKFAKADLKAQSFVELSKMEDKPYKEQKTLAKQIKNPELKQETLQLLDANERYKANLQEKDSTNIYNQVSNFVANQMRSEDPFDNTQQLNNSSVIIDGKKVRFADAIQRVSDSKQREAIYNLVDKPKESDENVKANVMELLRNGDFYGMKYPDLAQAKVGLNKEDSKFIDREWTKQNTETDAQERSKVNYIGSEIYRQYNANGLVKKDSYGKETPNSIKSRNAFDVMIRKKAESFPKNMSPAEISDYIGRETKEEVLRQAIEKRGVIGQMIDRFRGITPQEPQPVTPRRTKWQTKTGSPEDSTGPIAPTTNEPPPKTKSYGDLTSQEQIQLYNDYKAAHGGKGTTDSKELMKWNETR